MRPTTRSSLAVVAAAMSQVGVVDVVLASLAAGLAAWAVYALLVRWRRARWWPFVASTALPSPSLGPAISPTAARPWP